MRYFLYKQSFITKEEKEFISLPYNLNKSQFVAVLDNLSEEEDCTVTMKIYNQRDELVQSFDNLLVQKFNDLYTDIFEMEPNYKLKVKVDDTSSDEIEVHFSLLMIISKDLPVPPKIERPALTIIPDSFETGVDNFWERIQSEVRNGTAREKYKIGDQFYTTWTDENDTTYNVPLDIVHYGDVELKNGSVVPGMYLQWHYLAPYGVPLNQNYALYYTAEGLSAGTYYMTAKSSWGPYLSSGDNRSFTLKKNVPAGGLICTNIQLPYLHYANWRISTYENSTSTVAIESEVTVSSSSKGTFLGYFEDIPLNNDTSVSGLPHFHMAAYGSNRWSKSALRQWLNSSADVGKWWTPQTKFDRPCEEAASKRGFMAGFDRDFLSVVSEIKVVTANNRIETLLEDRDVTYDKFFLPSLEQEYIFSMVPGIEGEVWEYWKRVKRLSSPQGTYSSEIPEAIRYEIIDYTAQIGRFRSASLYTVYQSFYSTTTGAIHYFDNPVEIYRCAPACVIC